jgi:hypothetical protein
VEHYNAGVDLTAVNWRNTQAGTLPTQGGVLVDSYASIAGMLD